MAEFVIPSFLENQSPQEIYERMKVYAPDDMDTAEGSFFYDNNYPTAIEKAEIVEQQLVEIIKLINPNTTYGDQVDNLAKLAQTERRAARESTVNLLITGTVGMVIDKGKQFSTAAIGEIPSVIFETTESATIGALGVSVPTKCLSTGLVGNVPANTITLMPKPIPGILTITNPSAATGGTETEDDASCLERIQEIFTEYGGAGSPSDYKVWAKEVAGVGDATVLPEWQGVGTGTVKVVVIDTNGSPASAAIVQDVQNYIYPPSKDGKAPIGAVVTVVAPTGRTINYALTMTPNTSDNLTAIKAALLKLYKTVGSGGILKYKDVFTAIGNIKTITDFSGLTVNGGTANIQMGTDEYPVTGTVNGQ